MNKFTFNLPDIGEGIAEAEVVGWHIKVGDMVEEDQPLADMLTDKATVELESPVSGRVVKLAGEEGDIIAIGSMLVEIETEEAIPDEGPSNVRHHDDNDDDAGRAVAASSSSSFSAVVERQKDKDNIANRALPVDKPTPCERADDEADGKGKKEDKTGKGNKAASPVVRASPAVRRRAADLGVDLSLVPARGTHIRHGDLDAYLLNNGAQGYISASGTNRRADSAVKVIGLRRKIAQNMADSKRNIPHFSYVDEIDMTALELMRADLNVARGMRPKLTVLPFIITAITQVLADFPMLNATYDDAAGEVVHHGAVHMGIATQTDNGLIVPVLRNADRLNIWQMAQHIAALSKGVREGTAKAEELKGGTITLTSLGPLGGIATTPVINRPQVAIIGPNKIVERPVILDGELAVRKMMNLSISCDHRVVDGYDAAAYVQALKAKLETPVLLFAPV